MPEDWRVLEKKERINLGAAGDADLLDLTIRMAYKDLDGDLDPREIRKMACRQLKRIVQKWEEEEFIAHSTLHHEGARKEPAVEGPFHAPMRHERPKAKVALEWERPDLPKKELEDCHKLLEALLLMGVHGRAVGTGDIIKKRKLGARALYKIINPESEAYAYLKPYIHDMKSRGRRLLDLTPEGRELASRIRAGTITVSQKAKS